MSKKEETKDMSKTKKKSVKTETEGSEGTPQRRTESGRDAKGRFTKGNCANPAGRHKLPEEFKEFGKQAPERLRAIADNPETPIKVKADIEKWFAEMVYGKPRQQVDMDAVVEQTAPMTIEFVGALEDWSK